MSDALAFVLAYLALVIIILWKLDKMATTEKMQFALEALCKRTTEGRADAYVKTLCSFDWADRLPSEIDALKDEARLIDPNWEVWNVLAPIAYRQEVVA